jgi:excisionase family DNA binding protein
MRVLTINGVPASQTLTPTEVAQLAGVDPKTVTRWAKQGRLRCSRTAGGHRRYAAADVAELLGIDGTIDVTTTSSNGGPR